MSTTFVTAYLDLHEDRSKDKSIDKCVEHFTNLIKINIPIIVFLSKTFIEKIRNIATPNLHIIEIELEELTIFKQTMQVNSLNLPSNRTFHHDTLNFMILMNSKIEFIHRAISINPFITEQFAWIDFSICHIFKNLNKTLPYLYTLSNTKLKKGLYFPGCWDKNVGYSFVYDNVHWRFAGGFFIGDTNSLESMYNLYMDKFPIILNTHKRMLWEVNIWSILEQEYGLSPIWYLADHNDTIVHIPPSSIYVVASFTTIPSRINNSCKLAIDSIIPQVDHIYLSVSNFYKRFNTNIILPSYLLDKPYSQKVSVILTEDNGPATKYLGALDAISKYSWIFFCDDDQEYKPNLIYNMLSRINLFGVYQNRFSIIKSSTSGGIIHGFVGNLANTEMLKNLKTFPLPNCARFVDDQWMSIYYFLNKIPIFPTHIEMYYDIFKKLENNHELLGIDSLAALGTRDNCVKELSDYFMVDFIELGNIKKR